jgi:hypothetical protein
VYYGEDCDAALRLQNARADTYHSYTPTLRYRKEKNAVVTQINHIL